MSDALSVLGELQVSDEALALVDGWLGLKQGTTTMASVQDPPSQRNPRLGLGANPISKKDVEHSGKKTEARLLQQIKRKRRGGEFDDEDAADGTHPGAGDAHDNQDEEEEESRVTVGKTHKSLAGDAGPLKKTKKPSKAERKRRKRDKAAVQTPGSDLVSEASITTHQQARLDPSGTPLEQKHGLASTTVLMEETVSKAMRKRQKRKSLAMSLSSKDAMGVEDVPQVTALADNNPVVSSTVQSVVVEVTVPTSSQNSQAKAKDSLPLADQPPRKKRRKAKITNLGKQGTDDGETDPEYASFWAVGSSSPPKADRSMQDLVSNAGKFFTKTPKISTLPPEGFGEASESETRLPKAENTLDDDETDTKYCSFWSSEYPEPPHPPIGVDVLMDVGGHFVSKPLPVSNTLPEGFGEEIPAPAQLPLRAVKRPKQRSKQKNIRKDNRPLELVGVWIAWLLIICGRVVGRLANRSPQRPTYLQLKK